MAAAVDSAHLSNTLSDDDDLTGAAAPADSEEEGTLGNAEENGLDGDDLFGDGGDEEEEQPAGLRQLDDEDLDSGDDEGRTDRVEAQDAVEEEEQQMSFNFMDADIARHSIPEPSDGELYLLRVPRFLSIEPTAFNPKTFQAPTTDHHSKAPPSEHFSAFNTAMTTVRWRRSPSDHRKLQSNARILRWADGSLTLQFASDPMNQYEMSANPLAPPQVNPKIPTPTSIAVKGKRGANKESYTYLVAPYEEANVMRVTNKFTAGLDVVATANTKDTALEKLQSDLAAAAARGRDTADQAISFIDVNEDPELRRQREEQQYKEKQRQARAREKHELRERERANRTYHRSGIKTSGYGLSTDMLEGEEGGKRGFPGHKKQRAKPSRRDWSDDEDYGIRGRTREDEYDEEDDFIAASDEEPEIVDDDEDIDEEIIEEPRRGKGPQSPKRNRGGEDDSDEEVTINRTKRRRVVEDDDEDE